MSENKDYFKSIVFQLKSGTKLFQSELTLENGRMFFNH